MVGHITFIQDIRIDMQVDQVAACGQIGNRRGQRNARIARGRCCDHHIGGTDQLLFQRVEIAHINHENALGGQGRADVRTNPPLRMTQACGHRHRHPPQHAGDRRLRRIKIAVGVKPDQANPRVNAMGILQTADDAGNVATIAAGQQHCLAGATGRGNRCRNFTTQQA